MAKVSRSSVYARRRSDQKKAKSHSGIIRFVTGGAAQTQQSRQPLGDANGFAFVPHTVPWIPDTARWVIEPAEELDTRFDKGSIPLGATEGRSAT